MFNGDSVLCESASCGGLMRKDGLENVRHFVCTV